MANGEHVQRTNHGGAGAGAQARDASCTPRVRIEHQQTHDPRMYRRLLEYIANVVIKLQDDR